MIYFLKGITLLPCPGYFWITLKMETVTVQLSVQTLVVA